MTAFYRYSPSILAPLATALLLVALAAFSARRRHVPGAMPFAIGCALTALWAAGRTAQRAAIPVQTQVDWLQFQMLWQLPGVTATLCFVLEFAYPGRWLTWRNLALLSIPVAASTVLVLTGDRHGLMWTGPQQVGGDLVMAPGPAGRAMLIYALALVVPMVLALIGLMRRSPALRAPALLMIAGAIASRVVYLLTARDVVATLPIVYGTYALALFGFRIFDTEALAGRAALAQMHEAMLVLDSRGRLCSLNPAGRALLRMSAGEAIGLPVDELLPGYPGLPASNVPPSLDPIEITFDTDGGTRVYTLHQEALHGRSGIVTGYVLLLRDVTERRRSEAALRESEELRRLIFDHASDGIAIYVEHPEAETRTLLDCNDRYAEMSGYPREQLLGMGDTLQVQRPLPPVPYARSRLGLPTAQSEGFFAWIRPDGRDNIIYYSSVSINAGGRLLSIGFDRDVTEQMHAQALATERQRAEAMLQEREQLARELHDTLSQGLAYVNMQAEAADLYLQNGQADTARASLSSLSAAARDLHGDLRELIGQLLVVTLPAQGLGSSICDVATRFERQTGLAVELQIDPAAETACATGALPVANAVHLLRIAQEALANVRKHAGNPAHVRIELATRRAHLLLAIEDDGAGFVPESAIGDDHYGLRLMRQRAEAIGGQIAVESAPGQGTRVEVTVPLIELEAAA